MGWWYYEYIGNTMKYRQLDVNRDYQLGFPFMVNTPDCVAQAVLTRLLLWRGEWFLDTREGTPYMQDILGHNTNYDFEIQARILGTPGVTELINYSSNIDSTRNLTVNAQIQTVYGQVTIMFPQ